MLRCAFRLHRWGMLGYGLVLAVSALAQGSAFAQLAGTTAASRALFAREMGALAAQLTYLLPPPRRLDTLAGFVAWRAYGVFPLVVMVWAIAAAAGAVRGDEERQLVDTWLAARVSRTRLVASRIAAFAAAALGAAALSVLGALAGAAGTDPLALGPLAGQALALWLLAIALFSLCYLVAQLTVSPRGAQALGAAVVLVLYLLDVPARADRSLDGLAWASPFRWYRATDVLVPGGHLDAVGIGLTFAAILVAGALAALAFARRDVRGPLFARPVREGGVRDVAPSPALSWPVARLLYRQRWILLGWALITVVMAVFMVETARTVVDSLGDLPGLRAFFRSSGDPYRGFIALFWFGIAQLLLACLAVHLVATWGSDDTDGVLTAVLSTPQHRWAVIAERAAMALAGVAIVVAVGSLTAGITAALTGTPLDAGDVFTASWLLVPFALTFAAAGATGSARWPRAVVGVLGVLAFFSFLVFEFAPLLNWPSWVANLSVFQLYGTPLLTGVSWNGLWAMVGIVVVGFGLATLLMQRREVGT